MIAIEEKLAQNEPLLSTFTTGASAHVAMTQHMANLLGPRMYTRYFRTMPAELLQNAMDAMIAANVENPVITIKVPTAMDEYFYVQDCGTGATPEEVLKYFIGYGESSKRQSNAFMGHKGIGMKIVYKEPIVTIDTSKNGQIFRCLVKPNEMGIPTLYPLSVDENGKACTEPAPEALPQGTRIGFRVQPKDLHALRQGLKETLYWYPKQAIKVVGDTTFSWTTVKVADKPTKTDLGQLYIKQGNEGYPLNIRSLSSSDMLSSEKIEEMATFFDHFTAVYEVPMGSVMPNTTREGLELANSMTVSGILALYDRLKANFVLELEALKGLNYKQSMVKLHEIFPQQSANQFAFVTRDTDEKAFRDLVYNTLDPKKLDSIFVQYLIGLAFPDLCTDLLKELEGSFDKSLKIRETCSSISGARGYSSKFIDEPIEFFRDLLRPYNIREARLFVEDDPKSASKIGYCVKTSRMSVFSFQGSKEALDVIKKFAKELGVELELASTLPKAPVMPRASRSFTSGQGQEVEVQLRQVLMTMQGSIWKLAKSAQKMRDFSQEGIDCSFVIFTEPGKSALKSYNSEELYALNLAINSLKAAGVISEESYVWFAKASHKQKVLSKGFKDLMAEVEKAKSKKIELYAFNDSQMAAIKSFYSSERKIQAMQSTFKKYPEFKDMEGLISKISDQFSGNALKLNLIKGGTANSSTASNLSLIHDETFSNFLVLALSMDWTSWNHEANRGLLSSLTPAARALGLI